MDSQKILFIDRDGTIILEPPDEQVDSFEKWEFLPGVFEWLGKIVREMNYTLVMVTNQDGLGTEKFPEHAFWPVHNKMLRFLENEGIIFRDVYIDRSFEQEGKPTRKPGTGMLTKYIYGNYDLKNSFTIGDRKTDVLLARNLGCRSIRIGSEKDPDADYCVTSWREIYFILGGLHRKAEVYRRTSETEIRCQVNLSGEGKAEICTGIGFLNHMLEQWAKHGSMDITLDAKGDLHVDAHHLIEDVGIVLGMAFDKALGNRKSIGRYGFVLPMDDSEASVSIDFGGRPECVWKVYFSCEKIGEMPAEMMEHFFKSFSVHARCTIHVSAYGQNNHHKAEAVFKSSARAIRMALASSGFEGNVMSSKGVL